MMPADHLEIPLPQRRPLNDDHLLPLINVVFLLLIFFMLVGALDAPDTTDLSPPESLASTVPDDSAWTVVLDARGQLLLDDQPVSLTDLAVAAIERPPGGVVAVRADASIQATDVVDVLDVLRGAGVSKVQLLTIGKP